MRAHAQRPGTDCAKGCRLVQEADHIKACQSLVCRGQCRGQLFVRYDGLPRQIPQIDTRHADPHRPVQPGIQICRDHTGRNRHAVVRQGPLGRIPHHRHQGPAWVQRADQPVRGQHMAMDQPCCPKYMAQRDPLAQRKGQVALRQVFVT